MPNKKITALTALTGANTDVLDVYPIVDVSATETKKQTRAELFKNIPACDFVAANVWNDAGADVDQRMEGDTDPNLFYLDASTDRIGIGTNTPTAKLQVNGSFAVPANMWVTSDYTVAAGDYYVVNNKGATLTVTLPAPASNTGRILKFLTRTAHTINSASSNVLQKTGSLGTAILTKSPAEAGAWSELHCDGTQWIIMAAGTIP